MKADITEEGKLIITPETRLEQYAICEWMKENIGKPEEPNNSNVLYEHVFGSSPILMDMTELGDEFKPKIEQQ